MPPKSEAYYKRQREKEKKKKQTEGRAIASEHAAHGSPGNQRKEELKEATAQLESLGLRIADVPADGNCLFSALRQQLSLHGAGNRGLVAKNATQMRNLLAAHIESNEAEYAPFIASDYLDDAEIGSSVAAYCHSLASTMTHWGTMLEVRAAVELFRVRIAVVQATGVEYVDSPEPSPILWAIVFLKSFYTLGHHFAGTATITRIAQTEGATVSEQDSERREMGENES